MHEIADIAKFGRILIPKKTRQRFGLHRSGRVFIESRCHEPVIKPMHKKADDTVKKIAMMDLPVDDWELMEGEIEEYAQ